MASKADGSCIEEGSSKIKSINILILGEIGIGKTTFIKTFVRTLHAPHEKSGIFELYSLRMKYGEKELHVGLFDLYPGFNPLQRRESYPKNVHAILLCFSIGHFETLRSVFYVWIYEVRIHFGKDIPVLLVGLRSDARLGGPPTAGNDRIVEKSEAEKFHKIFDFHKDYIECSMYNRAGIFNAIYEAFFVAMES